MRWDEVLLVFGGFLLPEAFRRNRPNSHQTVAWDRAFVSLRFRQNITKPAFKPSAPMLGDDVRHDDFANDRPANWLIFAILGEL